LKDETVNKADLIDRIATGCGISKAQAATAIDTGLDIITSALKKGDRVALPGFGTFSVLQRKARNGRNPQTGATIKIAARRLAKFTPAAELRKSLNLRSFPKRARRAHEADAFVSVLGELSNFY
jgi:DNA-binding protein HU-beta